MQQKFILVILTFFFLNLNLHSQSLFDFGFSETGKLRNAVQQLEKSKKNFEYRKLFSSKSKNTELQKRIGAIGFDLRTLNVQAMAVDLHGYLLVPVFSIFSVGLGTKYFVDPLHMSKRNPGPIARIGFRPEWLLGVELPWFYLQSEMEYLFPKERAVLPELSNHILTIGLKKKLLISRSGNFNVYGMAGYTIPQNGLIELYPRPIQIKVGLCWRIRSRFRSV